MKRSLAAAVAASLLLLAGCSGSTRPAHRAIRLTVPVACPSAADGHGSMGVCAPSTLGLAGPHLNALASNTLGLAGPHLNALASNLPTFPDRSNNDPCECAAQIRAAGQVGLIVKANQGTGFIDQTAVPMIRDARAHGLTVGVYDFDQDYTTAEAATLVARARAAGIMPTSRDTFPLVFDVESGRFSYAGLVGQLAYAHHAGYRTAIYTGQWYWTPHAGCRWPGGPAWLAGYPSAPLPCGVPSSDFVMHQYTSTPIDLSVFLPGRSRFAAFVNAAPAGPSKRQIARWKRAAAASERAYVRRGCPSVERNIVWFSHHQHRPHLARRRSALAASRRVYARERCAVFAQRTAYFERRARS